jgi:SAM-dependent methyltransferase
MSLLVPIVDFLKTLDIEGEVLFIGHQTTFGKELGIPHRVLDQSDYEGADIVWDLGYPIPREYWRKFDFIFNGGCLDNMFNPAQAMMNFTQMLKVGGRLVCMESASSFNSPYLMYSPGWFCDYFEVNHFDSWKAYICSYKGWKELRYGPWKWFEYDHTKNRNGPAPKPGGDNLLVVTLAQKGAETTHDQQPIQYQYRPGVSEMPAIPGIWPLITDSLGLTLYKSKPYLNEMENFPH